MVVHVNLSDVSDEFEVLPEGVYAATLTDVELVEQDDEGKFPYFKCEFKLDDHVGRAWRNLSISPKAAFFLRQALEAFGEEEGVLDDEDGFDLDITDYIGTEVALHLTIEPYRGKDSNTVSEILPIEALEAPKARSRTRKTEEEKSTESKSRASTSRKKRSRRQVV